jgi:hypothetical protein
MAKLIVLNTALVGTFLGLKEVPLPLWAKVIAVAFFIVSLGSSFFGIYPVARFVLVDDPDTIEKDFVKAIEDKSDYLQFAASTLVIGLIVGLIGLSVGLFNSPTPIPIAQP